VGKRGISWAAGREEQGAGEEGGAWRGLAAMGVSMLGPMGWRIPNIVLTV
jgi:hypothetical protein